MKSAKDPRQDAILAAAGEVFREKGFETATTLDIARRAKVSKRELYRLFQSKQGLLDALVETFTRTAMLPPTLPKPENLQQFLAIMQKFGRVFLQELLNPRRVAIYRLAISEAQKSPKLGQVLQEFGVGPVTGTIQAFFNGAIESRILAQQDAEIALQIFFNMLIGSWQMKLLLGVQAPPTPQDIETQAARATEALRRYIRN